MYKLLVLTYLLASSLADPFGIQSWLREAGRRHRPPRGCGGQAGWRACAQLGDTRALAPHSGDCSVFFYCRGEGARPACRRCPAGLLFHPQLQVCDWPANVQCTPHPPRPSRPPRHNDTTPNPPTSDDDASVTVSTPDESNVDRSAHLPVKQPLTSVGDGVGVVDKLVSALV